MPSGQSVSPQNKLGKRPSRRLTGNNQGMIAGAVSMSTGDIMAPLRSNTNVVVSIMRMASVRSTVMTAAVINTTNSRLQKGRWQRSSRFRGGKC